MRRYGKIIKIEVPLLPPSINHAYISCVSKVRKGKKARVFKFMSKKGKDFVKTVKDILDNHPDKRLFPVDYNVRIDYKIHFPSRRRGDLSNRIKLAEDSLVPIVIKDDKFPLVSETYVTGMYDKGNPHITIEVIEILENDN